MKQFKTLLYLIVAIATVTILAIHIYAAQSDTLDQAKRNLTTGHAVVFNENTAIESLAAVLTSHEYVNTDEEALFIARHLKGRRQENGEQPNRITTLGGRLYGMELDSAGFAAIAPYPQLRLRAEMLAGEPEIDPEKRPVIDASTSERFSVKIRNEKGGLHRDTVYLCVREHYHEVVNKGGVITDCHSSDSVYAWIPICGRTDIWLPTKDARGLGRYFSVVPGEKGFVFGRPQGTFHNRRHGFKFIRSRAVLPFLGKETLKRMREDGSILLRAPEQYKDKFISIIAIFGSLWILAFLILVIIDKKRGGDSNLEILALVAILSGMGLVNLLNLQNPLWGEIYAWSQLKNGLALGILLLVACASVDWTSLHQVSRHVHLSSGKGEMQGLWLALTGIAIAGILLIGGEGPGGTRVTLPFLSIQGSPLIKILFVGYFAVIFACRGDLLEAYANPGKLWKQMLVLLTSILILAILGTLQLLISDLGPFLVIVVTAVFLFSLATKETVSMLIGTGLFAIVLMLGDRFVHFTYLPLAIFFVYAAIWSLYSYNIHGRVEISPIVLSLMVLLAFHGGLLFSLIGQDDIADRLNGRTAIAAHIFDNEVVGGSQIAEGVWSVARGGWYGVPESGLSATLPAGHTDLAFNSLVENMGIAGGGCVLLGIGILLFIALRIGIRNGHPFGFALGSLIALSIGIQAVLIILGSLGIIPLTGVTLPFISYGGTAMAVDLASVGILISLSRHKDYELERLNTQRYETMSRGQIRAYVVLASIALLTLFNYGCFSRDKYLIAPGKFINNYGERIPLANPLIEKTIKQLIPGDILDRNGKVLATTGEDGVRVYPYGDYTLLTVGDLDTKILWGTIGKHPSGLLAEQRYESPIRGYETHPKDLVIHSTRHYSQYLPDQPMDKEETVRIEDYSDLLPMMKSPKEIRKRNEHKGERSIHLTIDAELQKALSQKSANFVRDNINLTTDKTRVSIVVLDALDGSLLTSAMYPLPNQAKLRELALTNTTIYRDWAPGFKAYVDMDLGLVPLAPGSTAKLLSAGAGLVRFSTALADERFNQYVYDDEIIDVSLGEPTQSVSLKKAIVQSSNIYFIKLTSRYGKQGLYPEMAKLYYAVGAGFGKAVPYVLYPDQVITGEESYIEQVEQFGEAAAAKYADYVQSTERHRLKDAEYQPAWGQGELTMTPLALCRYVAACANGGGMMYPRYESRDSVHQYRQLMSAEEAEVLQDCMKGQADGRFGDFSRHIGGKTGTPGRADRAKGRNGQSNDALYCFFVDKDGSASGHPLAVVVRLERVNDNSKLAVKMTNDVVIPVLREKGYLR